MNIMSVDGNSPSCEYITNKKFRVSSCRFVDDTVSEKPILHLHTIHRCRHF